MAKYIFDKKGLRKVNEIEYLGNKICRLVSYYEKGEDQSLVLAALTDVLLNIKEIFKSYNERIKELEKPNLEYQEINETGGENNIKVILHDPKSKRKEVD